MLCSFEPPPWIQDTIPILLRRPYALAPIEIASLKIVQEQTEHPEDTAKGVGLEPSLVEQQSRAAELELEQCWEEMGESSHPPAPETPAHQPPKTTPTPTAAVPSEIPIWGDIRLRHDTGFKRKAYNTRRQLQLGDYEPQHLGDSRTRPRYTEGPQRPPALMHRQLSQLRSQARTQLRLHQGGPSR